MARLGNVLLESIEITRIRRGNEDQTTAQANHTGGMFFFAQRQYKKAEPFLRDAIAYRTKHEPELACFDELQYGICLLAQRKFKQAKEYMLIGLNGSGEMNISRPLRICRSDSLPKRSMPFARKMALNSVTRY